MINFSKPLVMGVVNLTPDSFYAASRLSNEAALLERVEQMLTDGAAILDLGGYSSRPGAAEVSLGDELERVVPAVCAVVRRFPEAIISVDTFRAEVAKAAVAEGAVIVNDITAGEGDKQMWDTVAALQVPYFLMHKQGTPQNMQKKPTYHDVTAEIIQYLSRKVYDCRQKGIKDVVVDPGFGFGKTIAHNYTLLKQLKAFQMLNCPLLVGVSRKSMIYKLLEITPEKALPATAALHLFALQNGANILRVHDVKEAVDCVTLYEQLK